MNRTIRTTKAFEKDLKRARKRGKNLDKLKEILDVLVTGEQLAPRFRPHKLTGNWSGFWECHIESDWLLIWIDEDEDTVVLSRLGSHSGLFR
ncbi:MAG: type II toxin-antitoxin system YafQ family toxin [Magnetococcales bacterium]|nr:type II toxin-antitoxin system YafQ family toxin [Magnetococcales bacterium]